MRHSISTVYNVRRLTSITAATANTSSRLIHAYTLGTPATPSSLILWPFARAASAMALSGRRGPLGDLAASCANLETPLPLIDIDNECLAYMASQVISATGPAHGQVYDKIGRAHV